MGRIGTTQLIEDPKGTDRVPVGRAGNTLARTVSLDQIKAHALADVVATIGLGNVTNTSDMDKPVSTAQQEAIDAVNASAVHIEGEETVTGAKWFSTSPIAPNDIRYYMDGQSGRPTLGAWQASQTTVDVTAAMQHALNSVSPLFIPAGVYCITQLTVPANTVLYGQGKASLIRKVAASGLPMLVNKDYDTASGYGAAGNIVVENLAFDDLGNLDTVSSTGDCVAFGHADKVEVRSCHFLNHKLHGVDFTAVKNARVHDNIFYSGKSSAIQIDGAGVGSILGIYADNTPSYNVEVFGNTVYSACYDPDSGTGGYVGGVHLHRGGHKKIRIHDNFIQGANQGIFADPNVDYDDISICNNFLYGKDSAGVTTKVYAGHHFAIRALCNMSNSRIEGNVFSGWDDGGIRATYNASPLTYASFLEVIGNKGSDTGGVLIDIVNNNDVTVSRNTLNMDRAAATIGVSLDGVTRFQCTANRVSGAGQAGAQTGIYIDNGALSTLSGLITGNHLSSLTTSVNINTGSDMLVEANKIKNCATPYLTIGGAATGINTAKNVHYDSGWTALNAASEIVLNHNLTLVPTELMVQVALDSSGSGARLATATDTGVGAFATEIGLTTMKVRGGANGVVGGFSNVGVWGVAQTDGYVRVRASI